MGRQTPQPKCGADEICKLLVEYNEILEKTFDNLLELHYHFELIHQFQDGHGKIRQQLLFKECLRHNIVPFTINENIKMYYYIGSFIVDSSSIAEGFSV